MCAGGGWPKCWPLLYRDSRELPGPPAPRPIFSAACQHEVNTLLQNNSASHVLEYNSDIDTIRNITDNNRNTIIGIRTRAYTHTHTLC